MKHTASRLLPYAVNGVIDIRNVKDVGLRRLILNENARPLIRRALKDIDSDLEILIPYDVDSAELQLKRYIQLKIGKKKGYEPVTIDMTELRQKCLKHYLKLYEYGSPVDVLKRWGFKVKYSSRMTEEELLEALGGISVDGTIKFSKEHQPLYNRTYDLAKAKGMDVKEYLASHGYSFRGGQSPLGGDKNGHGEIE